MITITPTPVFRVNLPPEVEARVQAEADPGKRIVVPERLVNPHPLVKSTRIALDHGWRDKYGALHGHVGDQVLDVRLSKTSLPRALRILDALFKALATRGGSVHLGTDKWERTYVAIAGEKVRIRLEEIFKQIDHVVTSKEKRDPPLFMDRWDYIPTGLLRFQIEEYAKAPRKRWAETETRRLDGMLNDIVKGILITAEALRVDRIAREKAEQERRAAAERQAEVERKQREEEARRRNLEQQAAQWAHSQNLRVFLQAVHQEAVRRGVPLDRDSPLGQWLAWAHEHADRLDPLGNLPSGSNAGTP
jgi:hypothetical protein